MKKRHLFFARNIEKGIIEMFSARYHGITTCRGSRLSYYPTNFADEKCGPVKYSSWENGRTNNLWAQLSAALGKDWQVLDNYQVLRLLDSKEAFAKMDSWLNDPAR